MARLKPMAVAKVCRRCNCNFTGTPARKVCDGCKKRNHKAANDKRKIVVKQLAIHFNRWKLALKCQACQYNKCPQALEFHHTKEKHFNFSPNAVVSKSFTLLCDELAQCTLVCANCHREIHYRKIQTPKPFGQQRAITFMNEIKIAADRARDMTE